MDWIQRSDYFSETEDRRYRISQAQVGGKWVYTAWKRIKREEDSMSAGADPGYGYIPILYTNSLSEARLACEKDAHG